jgi:DNA polymerase III subunit chi
MTEILFYHLERRGLEDVLPGLVVKSRERGWRVLVQCDSAERADAIDNRLWTYDDQSFLPHAQKGDGDAARQPVLIATEPGNDNGADILFLIGGAPAPDWSSAETNAFSRIVLLFDGRDQTMLAAARAAWKDANSANHDVTYWKESPSGRFEKQG